MFGFTPPATPQTAPTPCPECHSLLAIALYATLRTEYFRCVQCHHVWSLTHDEPAPDSPYEPERGSHFEPAPGSQDQPASNSDDEPEAAAVA